MAIVQTEHAETEEDDEEEEKRVKHYSSSHQILLVGDGDFSFSLCLAQSFGSASNIVASSLDSYEVVIKKYKNAKSNLENLEKLGASLLHGVDATKMKLHTDLKMRKFDRIIYNFPHAGFHGKEDNVLVIRRHMNLVQDFFRNARAMLRPNGEIHVNHKTTAPFCNWNLEELASRNSLALIECVDFKIEDYPGYSNKRGAGLRCDDPFPLGESSTFKFSFSITAKKNTKSMKNPCSPHVRNYKHQEIPIQMLHQPIVFNYCHSRSQLTSNTNYSPGYTGSLLAPQGPYQFQEIPIRTLYQPITFNSSQSRTELPTNTTYSPGYTGSSLAPQRPHQFQEIPIWTLHQPISFNSNQSRPELTTNTNYGPGFAGPPLAPRTFLQFQEIPIQMPHQPITLNSSQSRTELANNANYGPGYTGPASAHCRTHQYQEIPIQMPQQPVTFDSRQSRTELATKPVIIRDECYRIFGGYLNHSEVTFGRADYDLHYFVQQALRLGYERYMGETPERTLSGYIEILLELHSLSVSRSAWLRRMLLGLDHQP